TARVILQEIKKLTDQPVRYLVNSHWHWDHWGGNQAIREAFPGVAIISQEKTRNLMMKDSIDWNKDYLGTNIPEHIKEIDAVIADAKTKNVAADRIARLEKLKAADSDFLQQKLTLTN